MLKCNIENLWIGSFPVRLNMSFLSRRLKLLAQYENKFCLLSSKPFIGTFVCSAHKLVSGGPDRILESDKEYFLLKRLSCLLSSSV